MKAAPGSRPQGWVRHGLLISRSTWAHDPDTARRMSERHDLVAGYLDTHKTELELWQSREITYSEVLKRARRQVKQKAVAHEALSKAPTKRILKVRPGMQEDRPPTPTQAQTSPEDDSRHAQAPTPDEARRGVRGPRAPGPTAKDEPEPGTEPGE